jgi:hypothetical protein
LRFKGVEVQRFRGSKVQRFRADVLPANDAASLIEEHGFKSGIEFCQVLLEGYIRRVY